MARTSELERQTLALCSAAQMMVPADRRHRVEDFLTVLAAATGEAAIVASGVIDIEHNDLVPGAGLFADEVNLRLAGPTLDLAAAGPATVIGVLRDRLSPDVVDMSAFGSLQERYQRVAAGAGTVAWGAVAIDVPPDNQPKVLPLRAAFEMRPSVATADAICVRSFSKKHATQPEGWGRHVLCATTLASAMQQTAAALDPRLSLSLVLDVIFGTAKMVPMSNAGLAAGANNT